LRISVRLLVVAAAITSSARAQLKSSAQVVTAVSGGYTDNVLSVPPRDPNVPGSVGPQSDAFFQLRPGLIFTLAAPRTVQRLNCDFVADLYATHPNANSYSLRLEWLGYHQTSKVTELFVGASLTLGRTNTFNLGTDSANTPLSLTPAGGVTFLTAAVNESFAWDVTPQLRFLQTFRWSTYAPLDPKLTPLTFEVDMHLILERVFRRDALAVDLRNDHAHFHEVRDPTDPTRLISPTRDVLINSLVARWRHDYGHWWNTEIDAGVVEASLIASPTAVLVHPVALAAVRYLGDRGLAELSYQHNVLPNLIVGGTLLVDQVLLRGAVPFDRKRQVTLSSSVAYQYGRNIDFQSVNFPSTRAVFIADVTSATHAILVDVTITYMPRREIALFARYQLYDQIGQTNLASNLPSYVRNVIMIGVAGSYPGDPTAIVPSRPPLRVDRTDALTIPDTHTPEEPAPPAK
jgi:hypothetical protein